MTMRRADICHFAPSDFAIDWFLPFCFGAEPPADSLLKVRTDFCFWFFPGFLSFGDLGWWSIWCQRFRHGQTLPDSVQLFAKADSEFVS